MITDEKLVQQISQRLSLRKPQERSLDILRDVVARIDLSKAVDLEEALADIQSEYPSVWERCAPSCS